MPPQPTAGQSMQYLRASIFYTVIMYIFRLLFEIFASCPIIRIYLSEILIPDTSEFFRLLYISVSDSCIIGCIFNGIDCCESICAVLLSHCPSGTVIPRMVRMQPGRLVHLQGGHSLVLCARLLDRRLNYLTRLCSVSYGAFFGVY